MSSIYNRNCNSCGSFYKGSGKLFCSLKCVKRNPHSKETLIKLSRTWFKIGHSVSKEIRVKMSTKSKGRMPWNKGLKGFRSGERHNWMPVGENHWSRRLKDRIPKGENHWNYKKDRNTLSKKNERNDYAYQEWRMKVWKRDDFKCRMKNDDCSGSIIAHHILPWRDFVELRYEINNGITLCHAHHPLKRKDEAELSPYFQQLVAEIN